MSNSDAAWPLPEPNKRAALPPRRPSKRIPRDVASPSDEDAADSADADAAARDASETEDESMPDFPPSEHASDLTTSSRGASPASHEVQTDSGGEVEKEAAEIGDATSPEDRPRKRKAENTEPNVVRERFFKRAKSNISTRIYRELLNVDIEDASAQYNSLESPSFHFLHRDDGRLAGIMKAQVDLHSSQVGLTCWDVYEKECFFEALGRLGRHDTAGIAQRIGTKKEFEVAQYIQLLQEARDDMSNKTPSEIGYVKGLPEMPAAVEIGRGCCKALERAADEISLWQEEREEEVEEETWGKGNWLICKGHNPRSKHPPTELLSEGDAMFQVYNLLELSRNVFMAGSAEGSHWQDVAVQDEIPGIRRTALDDFLAIAKALTAKLVAATIHTTQVRQRTRNLASTAKSVVRSDVETAVASLGLSFDAWAFWRDCPRRLGLVVSDDNGEIMSIEEVESQLDEILESRRFRATRGRRIIVEEVDGTETNDDSDDTSASDDDGDEEVKNAGMSTSNGEDSDSEASLTTDEQGNTRPTELKDFDPEIIDEVLEIEAHAGIHGAPRYKDKCRLARKMELERIQDAQADSIDALASYYEEDWLWSILGLVPPDGQMLAVAEPIRLKAGHHVKHDKVLAAEKDWTQDASPASHWEQQVTHRLPQD